MGPSTNLLALPRLSSPSSITRWTSGSSRYPDIDIDVKGPPDLAKIAGGANSCVTDTTSSLVSSPVSICNLNTLSAAQPTTIVGHFVQGHNVSPVSSPSTSPTSSMASSISSFSNTASKFANPYNNKKSAFAAPMLSPASSVDSLDGFFGNGNSSSFLDTVFPSANMDRLSIPVQSSITGWKLAILDDVETDTRTLYAQAVNGTEQVCAREGVIALLDFGDEELECNQVVVVLNKKDVELAQQLHSLMYIGGNVVSPATSAHSQDHVLVGLEL